MTDAERQQSLSFVCASLLSVLPDAWAIYVFGSFARGEDWPDSDMDLAVL
jgi:predicted nucleotidyltransferase